MSNFFSKASSQGRQDRRQTAFAGTWYESDAGKLRTQLDGFFKVADKTLAEQPVEPGFAPNEKLSGDVLAIIVPHAGYMFSGNTAAFAYEAAAANRKVKRVFLLGPSHYVAFQGCALPSEKAFSTPLGDLIVDKETIEELRQYPGFTMMPEVHRREHSLELQLPFIKESFGDVKIVPIIVGMLGDASEISMVAQMLRRHIGPGDLVVVSSDFTHFGPRYQYEPFRDNIKENVKRLDSEAFQHLNESNLDGFLEFKERTQDTICGFYPCSVLLSMLPQGSHASLLRYRTSQDAVPDDLHNSVSYLAIAFSNSGSSWTTQQSESVNLSDTDKTNLLKIARKSLETFIRDQHQITPDEVKELVSPAMQKPMGVFVTLYKKGATTIGPHHDKELRGCVGYIFPIKSLVQAVIENAIGAATRDYRFKHVSPEELDKLQIDINALTPPHRVPSYNDIVIGRDGILMYKDGRQAVFLPSVATEFGWNLPQTLNQLALKAGFNEDAWKQDTRFDVFQSISFEED